MERRIVFNLMLLSRKGRGLRPVLFSFAVYWIIGQGPASAARCSQPNADAFAIHAVVPAYPPEAKFAEAEGRVIVRITIAANGSVTAASVLTSSGNAALDKAAVAAAKASTYTPKIVNCVPVPSTYAYAVSFADNGGGVPLTQVHVVPGLIGYARLGIETSRVTELLDNPTELAAANAQRYVDQVQRDLVALMPDKQNQISELRKSLAVSADRSNMGAAHSAWAAILSFTTSRLGAGTPAARSFAVGAAAVQIIHNAEVFSDTRADAVFRSVVGGESVLDTSLPRLKELRDAVRTAPSGNWREIDVRARALVDALLNDSK